jgi:hypothetical protein
MWHNYLSVVNRLDDPLLVHFGRYEKDFVQEMIRRYGVSGGLAGDELLARMFDVHAAIRTNVFFPVYSNSLKDIASFLGYQWQGPIRSGIDSIVWRYNWQESGDAGVKDRLLRYNHEDCMAVSAVLDHLYRLSQPTNGIAVQCVETDALPRQRAGEFGKSAFALAALESITKSAYFSYQQHKVFFRTDKHVRRSIRRKQHASKTTHTPNEVRSCDPLLRCSQCASARIVVNHSAQQTKTVGDLKFMRCGVKRWVVKYVTDRYQCLDCGKTGYSPDYPTKLPKFGASVASWSVHQHVALQQSFESITTSVNDLFGYSFSERMVQLAHSILAKRLSGNIWPVVWGIYAA